MNDHGTFYYGWGTRVDRGDQYWDEASRTKGSE